MTKIFTVVALTIITGNTSAQSLTNWNYYGATNPSALALDNRGGIYHESNYSGRKDLYSFYRSQTAGDISFRNGKHAIGVTNSLWNYSSTTTLQMLSNSTKLNYRYRIDVSERSQLMIGAGLGLGNYKLEYSDTSISQQNLGSFSIGATWMNERWKVGAAYGFNFQSQNNQIMNLFGERKFTFNENWSLKTNVQATLGLTSPPNSHLPVVLDMNIAAMATYKRFSFGLNYNAYLNLQAGYALGKNQNWKIGAEVGVRSGQLSSGGFLSWTLPNKK